MEGNSSINQQVVHIRQDYRFPVQSGPTYLVEDDFYAKNNRTNMDLIKEYLCNLIGKSNFSVQLNTDHNFFFYPQLILGSLIQDTQAGRVHGQASKVLALESFKIKITHEPSSTPLNLLYITLNQNMLIYQNQYLTQNQLRLFIDCRKTKVMPLNESCSSIFVQKQNIKSPDLNCFSLKINTKQQNVDIKKIFEKREYELNIGYRVGEFNYEISAPVLHLATQGPQHSLKEYHTSLAKIGELYKHLCGFLGECNLRYCDRIEPLKKRVYTENEEEIDIDTEFQKKKRRLTNLTQETKPTTSLDNEISMDQESSNTTATSPVSSEENSTVSVKINDLKTLAQECDTELVRPEMEDYVDLCAVDYDLMSQDDITMAIPLEDLN
jgi:hypothetical protein